MIGAAIFGGLLFSKGKWEFLTTSSLIASCSYFYLTYGMETSLYLCLIGLSLLLTRRNSDWMFVALALLVSTRSEGVFLAIPVTVYYLAKNRQLPRLGHILLSALILATPWIINQWYYGSPLPDSANAKIQHGRSGLWGEHLAFLHIGYMREWFFNGSLFSIVALLPLSLGGFLMSLKEANTRIILAFLVFLTVFYVGLNITGYHWYFAPYFYFLIMFCGVGLAELTHRRFDGAALTRRNAALIMLLGGLAFAYHNVVDLKPRGRAENYVSIGRWLQANTDTHASIALIEVGTVGWYCDRHLVDILGLVTKYNADYLANRDLYGWLRHSQPDYIVRHEPAWAHERAAASLENRGFYTRVTELQVPGLVLLRRTPGISNQDIVDVALSPSR
jgi:hypothetical protein